MIEIHLCTYIKFSKSIFKRKTVFFFKKNQWFPRWGGDAQGQSRVASTVNY